MRRLPVFLLIDSSTSMKGEGIDTVNEGIDYLISDLRTNPFALETVYLGIYTFNTEASIIRPFSDLLNNNDYSIEAKGRSNFGKGIDLLIDEMTRHVVKSSKNNKGDWKPITLLMTDGRPSDAWKNRLKKFHGINDGQWIICTCGDKVNMQIIESMSGSIVMLNRKSRSSIMAFFKWVSDSVAMHSMSIDMHKNDPSQSEKFKICLDK